MTTQPNPTDVDVPMKKPIEAGGNVAAFRPQNFDDAWRLANALANGSAKMIPDHYRGDVGATFAAMAKGAELGMSPMAALSTIAVINGRPALWGDALPALVLAHGHRLDEKVEGEGDKMVATATVTRGDSGQTITRTFSVDDAKKAQLWSKKGPWQQYPKRMLQMRARGFAVRDGCADAMVGLGVSEELSDIARGNRMRDVTPEEAGNAILATLPPVEDEVARDVGDDTEVQNVENDADEIETGRTVDAESYGDDRDAIVKELNAALSEGDIDMILDVYRIKIEEMRDAVPEMSAEIDELVEARRDAVK